VAATLAFTAAPFQPVKLTGKTGVGGLRFDKDKLLVDVAVRAGARVHGRR
jgi:hypothetical protein